MGMKGVLYQNPAINNESVMMIANIHSQGLLVAGFGGSFPSIMVEYQSK